ncbi:MAG: hypothetical protein WKF84_28760 [Pyrinomonadaceae bacterium]
MYFALAVHYGHSPEAVNELLRRNSHKASAREVACKITPELADAYVAAHPFAWELKLNASDYYQVTEAA